MIKTKWNLQLLYKHNKDPQIEADLQRAEAAYTAFATKYRDRTDYLSDAKLLAEALTEYEKLSAAEIGKPYMFFSYQQDLNSQDNEIEAKVNLLEERYNKAANQLTFFRVNLSKISAENQKDFLKAPELAPFRYYLSCVFKYSPHTLSEKEEKVLSLMSLPAHSLWVQGNQKNLTKQEIKWRGKKLPISEASNQMHNLPTGPRRRLSSIINTKLKEIAHFAEAEINAVVTNKKIIDELRHYTEPYEATLLSYETEPKTLENLRRAIDSNWAISHKFYRLKAKMMKLKSFAYADRNAKISKVNKKIEFKQAVEIVKKAFAKVDPEYADIFASFLNQGQVDVFAKKGKRGGAYCSSYETLPIFILLNHLADFNSVSTLAHETGHALHSHFSTKTQRPLYRDYTTATAEVASTLFENFVFDEVFPTLSKKEQVAALHDKINSSVQTIFRQMACFNFELELHNQIRAQGSLSKEKIAGLMNKHMQSYLGPLFKLTEDDGYFFVQWGHIRRFFYVYSYAFGELISNALYEKYKADKGFATQIKKFLSLGGSASPEEIFASIGLDIRQPNFFELGLKKIEADIDQLEKLLK